MYHTLRLPDMEEEDSNLIGAVVSERKFNVLRNVSRGIFPMTLSYSLLVPLDTFNFSPSL